MKLTKTYIDNRKSEPEMKELKKNLKKYHQLFEQMQEGFALHEVICNEKNEPIDYKFIEINPAFEKITGLKNENLIGRTVREILPNTESYWIERFGKVALTGNPAEFEDYSQELNKYFNIKAYCPEIGKFAVIFNDITEIKENEKKLVESRESFRHIFENSTLGIYRADPKGKIIIANKTVLKMFGFNSLKEMNKELENSNFYVNKSRRPFFRRVLFEKGRIFGFEEEMFKKDGGKISVRESAVLFKNEKGEILYYDGTIEDITDKKINEKITIEARKKAEQSEKIKTEFLRQMSHEIRTPVNVIMNYLQLLRDEDEFTKSEDSEIKEAYGAIKYASKRLIRTVDLTLNSSELLTNSYKSNKRDINIYSEILLKVYGEHKKTAKFKNLHFEIKKSSLYNFVYCDEYSVYQILDNLVDNAVKYTQQGSIIIAANNDSANNLIVTITDTGIGISKEYIKVIFEPFTQEKAGSSREFDGTGLGMTLVKGYSKINNIDIKLESRKNSGTKLSLLFNDTRK